MKRDWNVIRILLLEFENYIKYQTVVENISKLPLNIKDELSEYLNKQTLIAVESGLMTSHYLEGPYKFSTVKLTKKGIDLVDSIREDWVWEEIKKHCKENKIEGLTYDMIIRLAKKLKISKKIS